MADRLCAIYCVSHRFVMNYRLLLSEMLIDYYERREKTKCGKTYKVYTEVINDLQLALEIEPNQISIVQQAQSILNGG